MNTTRATLAVLATLTSCATGCTGFLEPTVTTRASVRPLTPRPDRATMVVLSERIPNPWPVMIRILDEEAEVVADVPSGEDAVFEAKPGAHVYAAFLGQGDVPFDPACVGALRATLAPGRTYAVRIWMGDRRRAGKRSCIELELVAARGQATPHAIASVHPLTQELLPPPRRPRVIGDDLDVREAVVGLAKLRIAGDRPTAFALPEALRPFAEAPAHTPWSPEVSVLTEDDGV